MPSKANVVGQTKAVGFEIGARKTFAIPLAQAWALLTSPAVVDRWLGAGAAVEWAKGAHYTTADGTTGEIRVVKPLSHLRLTWLPPGWAQPSTIQLRVIANGEQTVISFHQEQLAGPAARAAMRQRWQAVLDYLATVIQI